MSFRTSITGFFDSFQRARAAQNTYNRLSMMSDAQLARQGMTRNDISRRVLEDL